MNARVSSRLLAFALALCLAGSTGLTSGWWSSPAEATTLTPSLAKTVTATEQTAVHPSSFSLEEIPAYSGSPTAVVNDNEPSFLATDLTTTAFETYAPLDSLGRATSAYACVCKETMPTEKRGAIGMVRPTGWHLVKYDFVDGKYLYNRCHLLGYQLTAENANVSNLITGTRYLNVTGMLPYEDQIADYVKATGNHVLYRVTPAYEGNNLLANGVHMEALSVEDDGAGVKFNVFAYNVEPGVSIDYATGDSAADGTNPEPAADAAQYSYILNTNSKIIHRPDCSSVAQMSDKNKKDFDGTLAQAQALGYKPCSRCNPV